jgi:hypothetical protein
LPAATLLVVLFFVGACTDDEKNRTNDDPPEQKTEMTEETTSLATTLETTGDSRPPEVTLGDDSVGEPDVMIRLEGERPGPQALRVRPERAPTLLPYRETGQRKG